MSRLQKLLPHTARIIIILSVSLILVEATTRFWFTRLANEQQILKFGTLQDAKKLNDAADKPLLKLMPHRYLGYVPTPRFERNENRHNEWGYRGDSFPLSKPPGEYRIVCLGGSTTYTTFVPDPSLAYPALLQDELRKRGYDSVRVINSGVEGWTSYETLINFQLRVLELQPDMIVVYHGVNDALARVVHPFRYYRGDNSGYSTHSAGWYKHVSLMDRSLVLRIVRRQLGYSERLNLEATFNEIVPTALVWSFMHQQDLGTYPKGRFEKRPLTFLFDKNPPRYFRRNLANLVATASLHGTRVLLATFAYSEKQTFSHYWNSLSHPDFLYGVAQNNAVVQELGNELRVPVYDFAASFPDEEGLYDDTFHVTEAGAKLKAELFAEFIDQNKLIPDI